MWWVVKKEVKLSEGILLLRRIDSRIDVEKSIHAAGWLYRTRIITIFELVQEVLAT